ncbi:sel1 repeat family protein [Sulfurimonas sp. MAG313]|nr:tetratricopeptide repeat protein [Sulfurimonas sp. MAG313]MDF1880786.1 sel1 repeat family protein [Sulfurimonas sp. MAG313]
MMLSKKIIYIALLASTLLFASVVLEQVLKYYQENTLMQHPEAIQSLTLRANDGSKDAAFLLATAYKEGKLGQQDVSKAMFWYKKAAKMGDEDAMLMLGWLYYKGSATLMVDEEKARYWFSKASEKGLDEALEMLDLLENG